MASTVHLVIVLFALIQCGLCLQCYKCDSQVDPGCGGTFEAKSSWVTDCPSGKVCQKTKLPTIGGGSEPILRGCYDNTLCDDQSVCLDCDSDLCNSASGVEVTFILSLIVSVACIRSGILSS